MFQRKSSSAHFGMPQRSSQEHRWFSGINWRLMVDLRCEPPYAPNIRSKRDVSNFCPQSADVPHAPSYDAWINKYVARQEPGDG